MRKILSDLNIYYVNIRGIKSKILSLSEIIAEVEPTVIAITETHLGEKEKIDIQGYEVYRSNGSTQSGGVAIAILKKVSNIVVQVLERNNIGQSLWLLLNNTKIKLRIGLIYAPQEKDTLAKDLKIIYKEIEDQSKKAKENGELFLVMGDFNCKVGNVIKGNSSTVTKGGRLLIQTALKKSLTMLNAESMCRGIWTRVQEGKITQKSVLDYALVNEGLKKRINEILIDEEKLYAAYRVVKLATGNKTVYSDHNAMLIKTDITSVAQNSEKKSVMTKKSYNIYRELIERSNIKKLFATGTLQDNYNEWSTLVQNAIEKSKVTIKKKIPSKTIRYLTAIKKRLRKDLRSEKQPENRNIFKQRINLVRNHILNEHKKLRGIAIRKIVNNIRNNTKNGSQIWQIKKKINRKPRIQKALKSMQGKDLITRDEIIEEYKDYYIELLKTKQSSTIEEFIAETKVNSQFDLIKRNQEKLGGESSINEKLVKEALNSVKLRKAADSREWRGEWLKWGGMDMITSLTNMFIMMEQQKTIPEQWKEVIIQSIQKKKGSTLQETERGIFLTNVVSKVYEKIKKIQNEKVFDNMDQMQMAGRKKRSTVDNIIIVDSIIQSRKEKNQMTYLLFADAIKCFDKLWLKDCILEMIELGMEERDAWMIYQLNKETLAKVRTPVGETLQFRIEEIVKQGTVFGPILCCASSAKINTIGETYIVMYGDAVHLGMPVFMDDINAGGGPEDVRIGIRKLRLMETLKKTTFGLKKTVIMVVGKGCRELIEEEVELGRLNTVEKKDYMGMILNSEGNLKDHIEEMDRKACNSYKEILSIGSPCQVGAEYLNVRLELFQKCLLATIVYGIPAWGSISDKEIDSIEKIHGKYLKKLLQLPVSTPYAPIIMETGLWTLKERYKYLVMMVFHEIMNSDKDRKSREIIVHQIQNRKISNTIYGRVVEIGKETKIDVSQVMVKKSKWKKLCKERIIYLMSQRLKREMADKTKSRFVSKNQWERKKYFSEVDGRVAMDILKIRLNMWNLKKNYPKDLNDLKCPRCKIEEDTTEHVLSCYSQLKTDALYETDKGHWIEVVKVFQQRERDENQESQ